MATTRAFAEEQPPHPRILSGMLFHAQSVHVHPPKLCTCLCIATWCNPCLLALLTHTLCRRLMGVVDKYLLPALGLSQPITPLVDEFAGRLFTELDYVMVRACWQPALKRCSAPTRI